MLDLQQLTPDILDIIFKKLNKKDILKILIFDDKKIIEFIYDNFIYDNESTLIKRRFEKKKDYKFNFIKKISHDFYLIKKVVKNTTPETKKTIITNICGVTSTKKTIFEYELWKLHIKQYAMKAGLIPIIGYL
jgi:hypothetical protein